MKHAFFFSFILICNLLLSQDFSSSFYFENAEGNRDTIVVGLSTAGSDTIRNDFPEENIASDSWNDFDVRITDERIYREADSSGQLHAKSKFIKIDTFGESYTNLGIDINSDSWPVFIKWDTLPFDTLFDASYFSFKNSEDTFNEIDLSSNGEYILGVNELAEIHDLYKDTLDGGRVVTVKPKFNKAVRVNPNKGPQQVTINGWNLIFRDEFNGATINEDKWVTIDHNGWTQCDDEQKGNGRDHIHNPDNIDVDNGKLILKMTDDSYQDCSFSSAQVNTWGTDEGDVNDITFPEGSRIEVRAKLPFVQGVGSANWTWWHYPYREIDMWETKGHSNSKIFTNYYWQVYLNQYQSYGNYERSKSNSKEHTIKEKNCLFNCNINLGEKFINYTYTWENDKIKYLVNNEEIREISIDGNDGVNCGFGNNLACSTYCYLKSKIDSDVDFSYAPGGCLFNECCFPYETLDGKRMWLMLNIGTDLSKKDENPIDESELPASLEIEYVRVYIKDGFQAIEWEERQEEACPSTNSNTNYADFQVSHYPDVNYNWSSPALDFNSQTSNKVSAEVLQSANSGETYPVEVTANFPSGYSENLEASIYIEGSPPTPQTFIYNEVGCPGNCCFKPTLPAVEGWDYYWKLCTSSTFKKGVVLNLDGTEYSSFPDKLFMPSNSYCVEVKAVNSCGESGVYSDNRMVPNCSNKKASLTELLNEGKEVNDIKIYDLYGRLQYSSESVVRLENILNSLEKNKYYIVKYYDKEGILNTIQTVKF